jgi:SAM-dependent MidA family methyltransferase
VDSSTENEALRETIAARILSEGAISFREFMSLALYHPSLGYYSSWRGKMGRDGDYLTSPEVSPIFGLLVGRQLQEMWAEMGRPPQFQVVEVGAGTGALCHDLLRWARRAAPDLFRAIDYVIAEVSASLAERQRMSVEAEPEVAGRVRWLEALPPGIEGCVLSNELLDSMPVHRVSVQDGRLNELFVAWDGRRFVEEMRPPSSAEIEAYFQRLNLLPGEGCLAEVNLEALTWVEKAARALNRGYLLTLDYGYEAPEMFAPWRRGGTLACFHRHTVNDDPYARLGRQDMTSHVDFTSLRRVGEDAGLRTLGLVSQAEFLANLGIADLLSGPREGEISLEEYYARRRAATELLDPAALGRVRVLLQGKGVQGTSLTGLGRGSR